MESFEHVGGELPLVAKRSRAIDVLFPARPGLEEIPRVGVRVSKG